MSNVFKLQSDIQLFVNRRDLDGFVDSFILLAEAQFNRDLRVYQMENRATCSSENRYVARPDDWLETIRLTIDGEYRELEPLSTREMASRRANVRDATGTPRFFRNSENGFEVFPTPSEPTVYILEYYQKIPALELTDVQIPGQPAPIRENWLLTDHYDVYLYGTLMHAGVFLQDDTMIAKYAPLMSAAMQSLIRSSERASNSGAGRRMHVRGLGGSRNPSGRR
jgi:hypothetical protein